MAQSDKETNDEKAELRENMEIHIEDTLYDQNELGPLEDYVDKQVMEEANYDFHSNLYLMKMYSLYPFNAKEEIVVKVLIKALMNLPESDFTSLIYLIPVSLLAKGDDEVTFVGPIEVILTLGQYLEDCEFDLFWGEYESHQKMTLSLLTDLLDFSEERQVEKCIDALDLGWEVDAQKRIVSIPKTDENSNDVKRTTQVMSTESMNQIL